jgi:cytidylate kinase
VRIQDIRERLGMDKDAALRLIRANDKERTEFVRREFGADVADPRSYDITINTATFEPERADALVLMAYLVKFGQLPAATRDSIEPRPRAPEPVEAAL